MEDATEAMKQGFVTLNCVKENSARLLKNKCQSALNVEAKKSGKTVKNTEYKHTSAKNVQGASWNLFPRKTI